jgi:hypothetical protein
MGVSIKTNFYSPVTNKVRDIIYDVDVLDKEKTR